MPPLVLASASPRRLELLRMLGLTFEVRPVDLDESPRADEAADAMVLRLAEEKSRAASKPGELVLAADTMVVLDGSVLGKPQDEGEARRMLGRLQGRQHVVLTGVALLGPTGELRRHLERTEVRIAPMNDERIAWYVATGEPMDKAGAYAIQGLGSAFVESIRGNYTNVVGLPVPAVRELFAKLGYDLFADPVST